MHKILITQVTIKKSKKNIMKRTNENFKNIHKVVIETFQKMKKRRKENINKAKIKNIFFSALAVE